MVYQNLIQTWQPVANKNLANMMLRSHAGLVHIYYHKTALQGAVIQDKHIVLFC